MKKNRRKHTPDPFEKGRARQRVSAYPMDTTPLARGIQVVHQPSPLERGQGYETDPFEKGRARRRVSDYPMECSMNAQLIASRLHVEYKWCASLPLLRGTRGMKKTEENIPPAPLKWGGRGGGSVLTQWIPPYLHLVYKWCASLPLLKGARGMNKNRRKHTPDPFEKGRARRQVSAYPMDTTLLARGIQVARQPSTHKRGCADAPLLFLMIFQDGSGFLQSFSLSRWFSSLTFI